MNRKGFLKAALALPFGVGAARFAGRKPNPTRRRALTTAPADWPHTWEEPEPWALPDDAVLVASWIDEAAEMRYLKWQSAEFDEVPEGCRIVLGTLSG